MNKKLTIIIPIKSTNSRDISKRFNYCLNDKYLNREEINFLIVDDGSEKEDSLKFQKIAKELNFDYIYIETKDKPMSIARARNVGAMYAKTKYIMFMDIDLYPYDGFYNNILDEITNQNLEKNSNDFIMISVVYLTEKGNELIFKTDNSKTKNLLLQKLIENDENIIEKFSPGTSVNIYNRNSFLTHGGNNEEFEQWGSEDMEFNFRMIVHSNKFKLPKRFLLGYKNFRTINEYKGWRSIYRLYGDITMQKGIVLFHLNHIVDHKSNYIKEKKNNTKKMKKLMKRFIKNKEEPIKLKDLSKNINSMKEKIIQIKYEKINKNIEYQKININSNENFKISFNSILFDKYSYTLKRFEFIKKIFKVLK